MRSRSAMQKLIPIRGSIGAIPVVPTAAEDCRDLRVGAHRTRSATEWHTTCPSRAHRGRISCWSQMVFRAKKRIGTLQPIVDASVQENFVYMTRPVAALGRTHLKSSRRRLPVLITCARKRASRGWFVDECHVPMGPVETVRMDFWFSGWLGAIGWMATGAVLVE